MHLRKDPVPPMTVSKYSHIVVLEDIMVPMRDGVRLASDVYRPALEGVPAGEPLPTLLERTPYGKRDQERSRRARFFARHGYCVVLQDCRGCFDSEGELYFLRNEPFDGCDTVEWIARQPWCNGKVGTYGTSYAAWTQLGLATQNPPHLSCMFPNMGGWNAHTSTVRHGGAMELRFMAWAYWHSALNTNHILKHQPRIDEDLGKADFRHWLSRMPIRRGETELALVPNYEKWVFDIFQRGDYDDFWRQPGFAIEEYLRQLADVPTFLCGGWYDSYTRATLDTFVALSKHKKGPIYLLMGPWTHGTYTTQLSYAGDVDLGPSAALESFDELHVQWFDRWLKGKQNGIAREPSVKIFVMGGGTGTKNKDGRLDHGGSWRNEREWPLASTRYTSFYLQADGVLSPHSPTTDSSSTTYVFDPKNPVPTIGGNFSSLDYLKPYPPNVKLELIPSFLRREPITPNGGFEQREGPRFYGCKPPYQPLFARPDVLAFQTAPLDEDTEVTGPIQVKLWASSSAVDTDFTAKLLDVYLPSQDYSEGYALNLSDSIIRARYRNSREKANLLKPHEVVEFTINLYPTSNLFKRGHRIRLDLSSSNFPRFDVNPNTGELLGREGGTLLAENTIYHDRQHPSHIVLPIVPH
ncbi:MAG: CocE/NonD family hydrolase [Candidatus Binatia bacterium]